MYISIFWFIAKVLDIFSTELFLSKGNPEANPIAELVIDRYGMFGIFAMVHFSTFAIYFINYYFGHNKMIREILWITVAMSFTVALYNLSAIAFLN